MSRAQAGGGKQTYLFLLSLSLIFIFFVVVVVLGVARVGDLLSDGRRRSRRALAGVLGLARDVDLVVGGSAEADVEADGLERRGGGRRWRRRRRARLGGLC